MSNDDEIRTCEAGVPQSPTPFVDIPEDEGESILRKNSFSILMSREMLLDMGLLEPTPEERERRDRQLASYREMHARWMQQELWAHNTAVLRGETESTLRHLSMPLRVLYLHERQAQGTSGDPICVHCSAEAGDSGPIEYPCATVREVYEHYGIEYMDRHEIYRQERESDAV